MPQATIDQIRRCEEAGVDIVRVSCPDEDSTAALPAIVQGQRRCRSWPTFTSTISAPSRRPRPAPPACASIPAISAAPTACARWSRRPRTTAAPCASASMPGRWRRTCWRSTASPARRRWSSALDHARILQDHDFHEFKISVKASDVFLAVAAYQQLADACDYPAAYRRHRGGRPAHRHGEVRDRPGLAPVGGHRRHACASRCRPSPRKRCRSASSC